MLKINIRRLHTIKNSTMGIAIVKIIILLLILTVPFAIAKRRRRSKKNTNAVKVELSSTYCVNENGVLEEMNKQKIT
ncbi:MAG: hypothetical protein ABI367_16220 [Mucilaginibacter sp.]